MKKINSRELNSEEKKALIERIKSVGTYSKAFQDRDFMSRKELRPVRLQLELLKPELILREHHIHSTVVVFGSARLPSPAEAKQNLKDISGRLRREPRSRKLKEELKLARLRVKQARYYEEARRFGALVSEMQKKDKGLELVITTGGGPGIMEAANRGAFEVGAKSIGLNITLPQEQDPNPYITPELSFQFHYFSLRKMHFLMRCRALVAFPGGYGTFDELFEVLTLLQTGKKSHIPIVLVGREYWRRVVNFKYMAEQAMISPEDLEFIAVVETAEQAWRHIRRHWRN